MCGIDILYRYHLCDNTQCEIVISKWYFSSVMITASLHCICLCYNFFETVPFSRQGKIVYKEFGSVRGFDRKGERRVGAHPPVSRPTSGPPHRPQQTSTVAQNCVHWYEHLIIQISNSHAYLKIQCHELNLTSHRRMKWLKDVQYDVQHIRKL